MEKLTQIKALFSLKILENHAQAIDTAWAVRRNGGPVAAFLSPDKADFLFGEVDGDRGDEGIQVGGSA